MGFLSMWKLEAYVILPLGLIALVCLLSGIFTVQRLTLKFTNSPFTIGPMKTTLGGFALVISLITFIVQLCDSPMHLLNYDKSIIEASNTVMNTEMLDRNLMMHWRAQRNFWLSTCSVITWVTYFRTSQIIANLKKESHIE